MYYLLDLGSVVAAWALGVQVGESVLDMCAAPGGKSLVLAEAIGEEVVSHPFQVGRLNLRGGGGGGLPSNKMSSGTGEGFKELRL